MNKLTELTPEVLESLHVHSTMDSLRREAATAEIEVVEGNEKIPTLYYVTDNDETTVHALSSDLTKFLMVKSLAMKEFGLRGFKANYVRTEEDYNKYVDAAYREEYDWAASEASMPWLVITWDKTTDAEVDAKIKMDPEVEFQSTCDSVGTREESNHTLAVKAKKYIMFEVVNDLGMEDATPMSVIVTSEDRELKVSVE